MERKNQGRSNAANQGHHGRSGPKANDKNAASGSNPATLQAKRVRGNLDRGQVVSIDDMYRWFSFQRGVAISAVQEFVESAENDSVYSCYTAVCAPYFNHNIYTSSEVDCPRTGANAPPIADDFYCVHQTVRVIHELYGRLRRLIAEPRYSGLKLGLCTNKRMLSPSCFFKVPVSMGGSNAQSATAGAIQGIYWTCSNALRNSVWGYGFDHILEARHYDYLDRLYVQEIKAPDGTTCTYTKKERQEMQHFIVAARLLTLTPVEMMCYLAHEMSRKQLDTVFRDDEPTLDWLDEVRPVVARILNHLPGYAGVDVVVNPGVPASTYGTNQKVARVDQLFTVFTALSLLYEYTKGSAMLSVQRPDGSVDTVKSAEELLRAVYRVENDAVASLIAQYESEISKYSNEYAGLLWEMETKTWNEQKANQLKAVATALDNRVRMVREMRSKSTTGARFASIVTARQRQINPSILSDIQAFRATKIEDDPDWKVLSNNANLFKDATGMIASFGEARMDAHYRPGTFIHEIVCLKNDFPDTVREFSKLFRAHIRTDGLSNYLQSPESYAQKIKIFKRYAVLAAVLPRMVYSPDSVPTADVDVTEDILRKYVFNDPTDVLPYPKVLNPHMNMSHNIILAIERYMRVEEKMPHTAPEQAMAIFQVLVSAMNTLNSEIAQIYMYGDRGVGKSTTLDFITIRLFNQLVSMVTSKTSTAELKPEQRMTLPEVHDENTNAETIKAMENYHQIFKLHGEVPKILNTGAAAAYRATFRASLKRVTMAPKMLSNGSSTFGEKHDPTVRSVDSCVSTNTDPYALCPAASARFLTFGVPGGAISAQAVSFRREVNPNSKAALDFGTMMHSIWRSSIATYFLLEHCQLGKRNNNPFVVALMSFVPQGMMQALQGITFMNVIATKEDDKGATQSNVAMKNADQPDARIKDQQFFQNTQEAVFMKNLHDFMAEIARNNILRRRNVLAEKSNLSEFNQIRSEIHELFETLWNGHGPVQFGYGKSNSLLTPRDIANMMKHSERMSILDMVIRGLHMNHMAAGYSTPDRFLTIMARAEELYQLNVTDILYNARLVCRALDPVGQDSIVALGALLSQCIMDAMEKGKHIKPTADGYWKIADFFTHAVVVTSGAKATTKQAKQMKQQLPKRPVGRPRKAPLGEEKANIPLAAAVQSMHPSPGTEPAKLDSDGSTETILAEMPLNARPAFLIKAIRTVCPGIYGSDCEEWRIAMWTIIGTVRTDAEGKRKARPYISSVPFDQLEDTALYISQDLFTAYHAITIQLNDLVCQNSDERHCLTGNVVIESKNGVCSRYLEAAVFGAVQHDTQHPLVKNHPVFSHARISEDIIFGTSKSEAKRLSAPIQSNSDACQSGEGLLSEALVSLDDQKASRDRRAKEGDKAAEQKETQALTPPDDDDEYDIDAMLPKSWVDIKDDSFLYRAGIGQAIQKLGPFTLKKEFGRCAKVVREGKCQLFSGNSSMLDPLPDRQPTPVPPTVMMRSASTDQRNSKFTVGFLQRPKPVNAPVETSIQQPVSTSSASTSANSSFAHLSVPTVQKSGSPTTSNGTSTDLGRYQKSLFTPEGKSPHSDLVTSAIRATVLHASLVDEDSHSSGPNGLGFEDELHRAGPVDQDGMANRSAPGLVTQTDRWNRLLDALQYQYDNISSRVFVIFVDWIGKPAMVAQIMNDSRAMRRIPKDSPEALALQMIATYVQFMEDYQHQVLTQTEHGVHFPQICQDLLLQKQNANASNFWQINTQKTMLQSRHREMVNYYAAGLYPSAYIKDDGIRPITPWARPLYHPLPPVVLKTEELKATLKTKSIDPGTTTTFGDVNLSEDILFSLDYEGTVEERQRRLMYGDADYKQCPGNQPLTKKLHRLANIIQLYLGNVEKLMSFSQCSRNDAGDYYIESNEFPTQDFLHEMQISNSNPYLPVPISKQAKTIKMNASNIKACLEAMLIAFLYYVRYLYSTKHKLCHDPLDLCLYTAKSMGINWFRTAVTIVSEFVVSTSYPVDTVSKTMTRKLRSYFDKVIHANPVASEAARLRYYGDPSSTDSQRLKSCLCNEFEVDNMAMYHCMYIPVPDDIPLSKQELNTLLGLGNVTRMDLLRIRSEDSGNDAMSVVSSAEDELKHEQWTAADLRHIAKYDFNFASAIKLIPSRGGEPDVTGELQVSGAGAEEKKAPRKRKKNDDEDAEGPAESLGDMDTVDKDAQLLAELAAEEEEEQEEEDDDESDASSYDQRNHSRRRRSRSKSRNRRRNSRSASRSMTGSKPRKTARTEKPIETWLTRSSEKPQTRVANGTGHLDIDEDADLDQFRETLGDTMMERKNDVPLPVQVVMPPTPIEAGAFTTPVNVVPALGPSLLDERTKAIEDAMSQFCIDGQTEELRKAVEAFRAYVGTNTPLPNEYYRRLLFSADAAITGKWKPLEED